MYLFIFFLWIIFNGNITCEIVLFGLVLSAGVYFFMCRFLDWSIKRDLILFKRGKWFLYYLCVLFVEIVKANFATIRLVFSGKYEIEPVIVTFQVPIKSRTLRVILANSITLTPGNITVSMTEEEYVVHCLDKDFSKGLEDSVFVQILQKMEKAGIGNE